MPKFTVTLDSQPYCVDTTALTVVRGACPPTTPPPTDVPIYSDIDYPNTPGDPVRRHVDITRFENVFGHMSGLDSAVMFPGRAGSQPTILAFPRDRTVAMATGPIPAGRFFGTPRVGSYASQVMDIGISLRPDTWPTDPRYVRFAVGTGAEGPTWSTYLTNKALLTPGLSYFFLFRLHEPHTGTVMVGLNHTFGVVS